MEIWWPLNSVMPMREVLWISWLSSWKGWLNIFAPRRGRCQHRANP
jgi:hypothetical protein